jgi:hypothetical protein
MTGLMPPPGPKIASLEGRNFRCAVVSLASGRGTFSGSPVDPIACLALRSLALTLALAL